MTGEELRALMVEKWGCSYDVQLRRVGGKILLQIMWRYQEQVSFPLTALEYLSHLETVTTYLNDWQVSEQVKTSIAEQRSRPRLGKAISIPLNLQGGRQAEWLLS